MTLKINFLLTPGGTKLASCSYKGTYLAVCGLTWEEAEANLVVLVLQRLIQEQKIPPAKEIEI